MTAGTMEAIKVIVGIVAILIGLLAGCATRKQSTNERAALHTRLEETAKQERRLRRLEQTSSASIRLGYANNVTEITPVGTFRLSVDSGYVGQAERVVIHRNSGRIEETESDVAIASVDSSAAMAATREYTAAQRDTRMKQQEADVSPLLKIPWWVWLGVVCGVIYLVRRIWKR